MEDRVYPCPSDLQTLIEKLQETDEGLSMTFYPSELVDFVPRLHELSYIEVKNTLQKYGVRPYVLEWGDDSIVTWSHDPRPRIVSIYDKVDRATAKKWREYFLSFHTLEDMDLEFFPLMCFFRDKRFLKLGFYRIPGNRIPSFQKFSSFLLSQGYSLTEFSVQLHNCTSASYVDFQTYSGTLYAANGNLRFEDSIPLSRQRQFIDAE